MRSVFQSRTAQLQLIVDEQARPKETMREIFGSILPSPYAQSGTSAKLHTAQPRLNSAKDRVMNKTHPCYVQENNVMLRVDLIMLNQQAKKGPSDHF
jgi:hypothetical protein